jgi:selenocysteine-specific elongation factor
LERRGPTSADDLLSDSRLDDDAQTALAQLVDEDKAMVLSEEKWRQGQGLGGTERIVTRRWWKTQTEYLEEELADYHQRFPLRKGMPREALRSGLRMEPEIFDALLARAAQQGLLADEGATVRLSSHTVQFTPQQNQQVDELLTRFQRQPYTPPSVKDSASAVGEEVLNVLIDRGELVQVSDDVLFLSDTYQKMVEQVQNYIEQQGSVTLAETRDMFDSSRKYAQALLEHLDEAGVTKRVGDKRILRGA